ncbi:DUF4139 domain-containing protein [Brevundimonas sp. FT23042]|uniref:DUF4139 domain-containing protein n=1 Tax=Brevundimonas sp. FT23042 TaxID=3393749 RepID=UPI003B58AF85
MRRLMVAAVLSALAQPTLAQVEGVSARSDRTTVVIYRDQAIDTSEQFEQLRERDPETALYQGLALIIETREVDVPAGETVLRFEGLAAGIVPETASIDGLRGQVLERNTDFELLSPGGLLQHAIGETIRVAQTNRETGTEVLRTAIVRSGADGPVLEIDGRIEALSCQGLTRRLIFDRVPEGLGEAPILSVRVRSPDGGRQTVRLAYLARGLQWSADYVARVMPDGRSMAIEGWITLMNFGGSRFTDAPVHVVAGNLNREDHSEPVEPLIRTPHDGCWPMDRTTHGPLSGPPRLQVRTPVVDYLATIPGMSNSLVDSEFDEIVVTGSRIRAALANLGDYKIYSLPEPTDVNPHQAKQVRFLDQPDVRFERTYTAVLPMDEVDEEEPPAAVLLVRMRNSGDQGLGVPMPGGGFSLMETQDGATLLTGQSRFRDRADGAPLELEFGEAMGVHVAYVLQDEREWRSGAVFMKEATVVATVTNDKSWPIDIELFPDWSARRGFRVTAESRRRIVTPSGETAWRLHVPANSSASLRFRARVED